MKAVKDIIAGVASEDDVLDLIFKWKDLVGKATSRMSFPVGIRGKTLFIAVPNNMVKQQLSHLKDMILETLNRKQNRHFISLRFIVKPELFKKKRTKKKKDFQESKISLSSEDVKKKKKALESRGFSSEMIEVFAEIEALIEKKNSKNS